MTVKAAAKEAAVLERKGSKADPTFLGIILEAE
jgi:hypothetical protein